MKDKTMFKTNEVQFILDSIKKFDGFGHTRDEVVKKLRRLIEPKECKDFGGVIAYKSPFNGKWAVDIPETLIFSVSLPDEAEKLAMSIIGAAQYARAQNKLPKPDDPF
jgi:hypothetical protein